MSHNAELLAIGNFSNDIKDILDYPPEYYEDTPEGSIICTGLAWMPTTDSSERLAEAFGIDSWKFEEHVFIPSKVDWDLLSELEKRTCNDDLCETVRRLMEKDFLFIYRLG